MLLAWTERGRWTEWRMARWVMGAARRCGCAGTCCEALPLLLYHCCSRSTALGVLLCRQRHVMPTVASREGLDGALACRLPSKLLSAARRYPILRARRIRIRPAWQVLLSR